MSAARFAGVQLAWLAMALLASHGCARVEARGKSPLLPPARSPDSVTLEIASIRFPAGDDELDLTLWNEIDEQVVPIELRSRLASNGLRIGLVAGQLPAAIERLLKLDALSPLPSDGATTVDFANDAPVHCRRLQLRQHQEPRPRIIVTGERQRHAALTLLVRSDSGEVQGKTYAQAMGLFSLFTEGLPDGRIQLELLPEVEFGDAKRQFIGQGEGFSQIAIRPDSEAFEELRARLVLGTGETLFVGCRSDRPGTLGNRYFTELSSGTHERKLILIRLAQSAEGDLFGGRRAEDGGRKAEGGSNSE